MEVIRKEKPADIEGIRAIHLACFPTDGEANLVDALRSEGLAVVSLVAVLNNEVVGHIMFSPVSVEGVKSSIAKGLGLAPVAVLPGHQGTGIGSHLIREGLKQAEIAGFDYVVCLGEPGYYRRFGFIPARSYGLDNEYGAGAEFMALELKKDALAGTQGLVKYALPFQELT